MRLPNLTNKNKIFFALILIIFIGAFLFSKWTNVFYKEINTPEQNLAATVLYPGGGGTGTSTPPSYGQLLVGNSGGTYTLTATSSLNISASTYSGFGAEFYNYFSATTTDYLTEGATNKYWQNTLSDISLAKGNFMVGNDAGVAQATSSIFISSTGNVGIGTTSPWAKLSINNYSAGASTMPLFVIASSTSSGATSTAFIVNSYGSVGIGTTAPGAPLDISTTVATVFQATRYGGTPSFVLRSSNGTASVPTASAANDVLGVFGFRGYGATGFPAGSKAGLFAYAAENWTDTAQGTYLTFEVTPTGSVNRVEKLRINNDGNVGIGTTSPYAKLSVGGKGVFNRDVSADYFTATSTTATSTIAWGLQANALNITSTTASSTFANGINLTSGCFAIGGTCVGAGGSGTVTSVATTYPVTGGTFTTSGTIALAFGTTTSNTWAGTQTFGNASTTLLTVATGIYLPADSVEEADINFITSCGTGNHLYISGGNLACEADDDVPEAADYSNLTGGRSITNNPTGTIDADSELYTKSISFGWSSSTPATTTSYMSHRFTKAATVVGAYGHCNNLGTSSVMLQVNGTNIFDTLFNIGYFVESLGASKSTTTFNTTAIGAGNWITFDTGSAYSGSARDCMVNLEYTIND